MQQATTPEEQDGSRWPTPPSPPDPAGATPAWVRLLLTDREQELPPKVQWKVMLRALTPPRGTPRERRLDGPAKAILLWLWERMYGARTAARPSQGTLARDSGYSRNLVGEVLARAQRLELVRIEERRRPDGGRAASSYSLTWPPRHPYA